MRKFLISLLLVPMLAAAHTLRVEPGELAASPVEGFQGSSLVLEGAINAADLDWLCRVAPAGSTVDLSAVAVAPYSGKTVGAGSCEAPADALPPYILAGLRASRLLLPTSLKSIGAGALLDAALTEIEIPAGVTALGEAAFAGCLNLEKVTFAEGSVLDSIPSRCFDGDARLSQVTLPSSLSRIGTRAFVGCNSLLSIAFPATLTAIADEAFASSGLESVELGECKSLRHIGARAWAECSGLATATLPASAMLGGEAIFMGCPLLTSVTLPAGATSIPALTLTGATELASIAIPAGVDSIGSLAFAHNTGLEQIDASALGSVPSLGEEVWAGVECQNVILRATSETERDFLDALQWQDFSIVTSGIVTLLAPGVPDDGDVTVRASFTGNTLTLSCDLPVSLVTVHALDGTTLEMRPASPVRLLSTDTLALGGSVMIVRAILEGSPSPVTLKLLRR